MWSFICISCVEAVHISAVVSMQQLFTARAAV